MENTTVLRSKLPCVSSSSGSCKPFRLGTACRNPGTSTVGAGGTQKPLQVSAHRPDDAGQQAASKRQRGNQGEDMLTVSATCADVEQQAGGRDNVQRRANWPPESNARSATSVGTYAFAAGDHVWIANDCQVPVSTAKNNTPRGFGAVRTESTAGAKLQ